jgi:hypothetical protein
MKGKSMMVRWIKKQCGRIRRVLGVAPHLFDSPRGVAFGFLQLCRIILFNGLEGFKAFCRRLEEQQNVMSRQHPPPQMAEQVSHKHNVLNGGSHADHLTVQNPCKPGYLIVAPPYVSSSAGIHGMYRWCDELNRRDFPSYIVGSDRTAPAMNAPLIGWSDAKNLCKQGYIAIYPETVTGNPLHARNVVRWVANRPGLLGGEEVYDESELVFYHAEQYVPYIRNRIAGKFYIPTIDESLFFCTDGDLSKRSLECFYVGKSQWKDGFFDRSKVFEITRDMPLKKELGKLLRASRVLYNFDNSTILTYEAILCGCPVVIIPDGTQTREDYERSELGMEGIAWGPEEQDRVKVDAPGLHRRYQQVKREFIQQLDDFITITQRHALCFALSPTSKILTWDDGSRSFRAIA